MSWYLDDGLPAYMYITLSFLSSFCTWSAAGNLFATIKVLSRITVATIKKKSNINTMSGSDAVEMAGKSPPFFFLNFDIFELLLIEFSGFCF